MHTAQILLARWHSQTNTATRIALTEAAQTAQHQIAGLAAAAAEARAGQESSTGLVESLKKEIRLKEASFHAALNELEVSNPNPNPNPKFLNSLTLIGGLECCIEGSPA